MTHMLVVSTDQRFQLTLVRDLKRQGIRAIGINGISSMAAAVGIHQPDIIVFDLPAESGTAMLEICKQLRNWSGIPVIIVSSMNDSNIEVEVLNIVGADYITKPFSVNELIERIHTLQQKVNDTSSSLYCTHELYVDISRRLVTLKGKTIHLTRSEYKLLHALVTAQGQSVSYKKLLAAVNTKTEEYTTIRQLIRRLRTKLNDSVDNPRYILTEPGIGYRLSMEQDDSEVTFQA
jgi:two-component system, OmpR family, KDP operon response regulator KdpE